MPGFKKIVLAFTLAAPLMLAACGDGYVTQPYKGVPYDGKGIDSDDRTAGYGVEYVLANMMPAKSVNTESVTTTTKAAPPPPPPPAPIKSAEPMYNKAQEK